MKKFLVPVFILSCLCGCASKLAVSNTTTIGTDASGMAVGQYSDSRSGEIQGPTTAWLGGAGGGGGIGGVGLGSIFGGYSTGRVESQGDPMRFARAIATINYSRRLEKMGVEDAGGSRDFTFTDRPIRKRSYQPFGHQTE